VARFAAATAGAAVAQSAPVMSEERKSKMAKKEFVGRENRARLFDSRNVPTDRTADRGIVTSPGEITAPGLCSAAPMRDPHAQGRGHFDNMAVKPGEESRSKYTAETKRRLTPGSGVGYK
jgi:hypothetical protein